jgi:hypothetical protein
LTVSAADTGATVATAGQRKENRKRSMPLIEGQIGKSLRMRRHGLRLRITLRLPQIHHRARDITDVPLALAGPQPKSIDAIKIT